MTKPTKPTKLTIHIELLNALSALPVTIRDFRVFVNDYTGFEVSMNLADNAKRTGILKDIQAIVFDIALKNDLAIQSYSCKDSDEAGVLPKGANIKLNTLLWI